MNGLQITGMKLTSPVPTKKIQIKPIQQNMSTKTPIKKPAISKINNMKTSKKQTQKKTESKVQIKKQQKVQKKLQETQQKSQSNKQIKVQQHPIEEIKVQSPPKPIEYQVLVRYNHYKEKFICINNVLNFAIIDDKYAFSYVFKGNFVPILKNWSNKQEVLCYQSEKKNLQEDKIDRVFQWQVQQNGQYGLQIQQDEEQQAKRQRKVYRAPISEKKCCPFKKNRMVQQLTEQMKKLGVQELGSEKHRELLQQRDLEDLLFS